MARTKGAWCLGRSKPENEARTKMWTSMRIHVVFGLADLQVTAEASYDSAKKYVRFLERAGYLRRVRKNNGRAGVNAAWMIVRNSGPVAPILRGGQRPDRIYDPNLDQVFNAAGDALAEAAGGAA